jgi:HD-GYP domain-containing protein (c-di-GMP phosphodiesterase class II)
MSPRSLALTAGALTGSLIVGTLIQRQRAAVRGAERFIAATLETLLNAIDANDHETGAHVRRVASYSLTLATAAEVDESECRNIERVALFHDIGKIHEALVDIIHDSSTLTPEEWRAIATHPQRGADVLEPLTAFYPDLGAGVLAHHERWDGRGYPRGLRGRRIPVAARVVAICDSFDAITHSRRYRPGKAPRMGAEAIAAGRGTQFDPELTDLFLLPPVFEQILKNMRDAHSARPPRNDRRVGGGGPTAPDVAFRWRPEPRTGSRSRTSSARLSPAARQRS